MDNKPFIGLLYGWVVIFASIIIVSMILTFILRITAMTEARLTWASLIIGLIILFAGGIVAGVKSKQKGWVIGGLVGLGFTFFIFIVQYLGFQESFSMNQILHHIGYIFAAMLGGVVGVNVSSQTKTSS